MNVTSRIYNALIRRELPPPICVSDINYKQYKRRGFALLHAASCRVGRAFLCLALLPLSFASCEKEVVRYEEMAQYHQESLSLPSVATDSVSRFSQKVTAFVAQHPAAAEDPLYPEIQQNIRQALLRITITIDDEWDGEIHRNF